MVSSKIVGPNYAGSIVFRENDLEKVDQTRQVIRAVFIDEAKMDPKLRNEHYYYLLATA